VKYTTGFARESYPIVNARPYRWLPALRDGNKITAGLHGLEVRWGMQPAVLLRL